MHPSRRSEVGPADCAAPAEVYLSTNLSQTTLFPAGVRPSLRPWGTWCGEDSSSSASSMLLGSVRRSTLQLPGGQQHQGVCGLTKSLSSMVLSSGPRAWPLTRGSHSAAAVKWNTNELPRDLFSL